MATAPVCYRHPDRLAVERCETCGQPVCGACLWYAEAGQRLCPDHAAEALRAGQAVTPPERYAEAIAASQASAAQPAQPDAPYKGNSTDLAALAAAGAGLAATLACCGQTWTLPLIAFALGLVAWLQHKDALDPRRARRLGLLGLAGGGVFVVAVLGSLLLAAMCFLLQFAFLAASGNGYSFPTPTP